MTIDLYTAATPNGYKISIALEELQIPYRVHALDLGRREQKSYEFRQINPNGRIPAIVDRQSRNFAVFESGAILVYLAELGGALLPRDARQRSVALQWLMFQVGGVGPMQGQANVFHRYFPEKIPSAIERFQKETRRLYEVLDRRLMDRGYLADSFSIADIANYCWVRSHDWSGVSIDGLPSLTRWLKDIGTRPAVRRGLEVPPRQTDGNTVQMAQRMLV